MPLSLSARGAALVADHEGLVLRLYDDPAGHCTIGIGHLVHRGNCDGSEPERFRRGLTKQEAYDLFIEDVSRFADAVNRLVRVPLTQTQFDALVSFAYNVGEGALEGSNLLRKLNAGDFAAAAAEFGKWVKATNAQGQLVTLPGLVRRRAAEAKLFMEGADDATNEPPVRGLDHLHPVFAIRVANACRRRGTSVYSGARSTERQRQLYEDYLAGRGNPANPPGTSWHEYGEGIPGGRWAMAVDFAEPYPHGEPGLVFPIRGEPWHGQPAEITESARVWGAENRLPPIPDKPAPTEEDDDMKLVWHTGALFLLADGKRSPWGLQPIACDALIAAGVRGGGKPDDDQSDLFSMLPPFGGGRASAAGLAAEAAYDDETIERYVAAFAAQG
ncbi:MAG: glycoside hydrolase family protein [Chloroflexi bacterium]|nr:glycoside hydrolase family protein [Chloroflexota bacterium]